MPTCADGKSKKVKVGSTVKETNVKTVDVNLTSPGTRTTPRKWDQNREECERAGAEVGQVSKTVLDLCLVF